MLELVSRVSKALAAAVAAGVASYGTAVQDGQVAGDEWVTLVVAVVGAFVVVWLAPRNTEPA